MLVKTKIRFLLLTVILAAIVFSTCEAPMGMGPPIDWEDPVLTMEKVPNPLYVRRGTILTGTVTDNVGVERVVFTDKSTGEELFPVVRNGDNWIIELLFTEEENGKKIIGEIRAYDKMNNSGDRSFAVLTMIIDILPPIVENISIKRTDTRIAYLEPLSVLKELEESDPRGEKKDNLSKYQNGWFSINCETDDDETTVDIVSLDFYDIRDINTVLHSFPIDPGISKFFPRWTIKEEVLINAGQERFGGTYKADYYKRDGARYYYRVVVKAFDKGDNQSIEEEEGYLCMWSKSDEPKGILDPVIGTHVSRGTPLPVDFYDDDQLLWAYTGLLTIEQWNGLKPVAPEGSADRYIPSEITTTNDQKLQWLKNKLTGREGDDTTPGRTQGEVYNWLYDRYYSTFNTFETKDKTITDVINNRKLDVQTVYVQTGRAEEDYGEYVLFSIAADDKLPPHNGEGPEWTNKNVWRGRVEYVFIIDENAPLIVFDTPAGSPEENTFPKLEDGEFFDIIGYTLRENASDNNKVTTFRMAWIPFNMPDKQSGPRGGDGYIRDVQAALRYDNFTGMPAGVQYWDFTETGEPGTGLLHDDGNETITTNNSSNPSEIKTSIYRKQSFTKRLSVLGGFDDIKPETRNFFYNNKVENETKLFILYAVDNMGHEVFRQLRLLANKTPPEFVIYDFTHYLDSDLFLPPSDPSLPDPNNAKYNTGGVFNQALYYPDLNAVNAEKYGTIKSVIGTRTIDGALIPSTWNEPPTKDDIAIPFQIYPRGTIVKYWIVAETEGVIALDSIVMKDITFSGGGQAVGSPYVADLHDLTFCEFYPDVTQRTFLFEATDKLGNVARIQRTVAVTNAAKLENITTTTQSGTYGIDKEIILQANFSSQVYAAGHDKHPKLNIRYWLANGTPVYKQIECTEHLTASDPGTVLNFKFIVPKDTGGTGIIETLYEDAVLFPGATRDRRPIILEGFPEHLKIVDANRGDPAFIPGYTSESITMPNWASRKNSLQERKSIRLDGIRPSVTSAAMRGKTAASANTYYFRDGETLEFTLTADEDIRPSGAPVILYDRFLNAAGTGSPQAADTVNFKYQRPSGQRSLVFSLSVNDLPANTVGLINNFRLNSVNGIVDIADNTVEPDTVKELLKLTGIPSNTVIYIKRTVPAAPRVTLKNGATAVLEGTGTLSSGTAEYNFNPVLEVQASQAAAFAEFEDTIQYSLDGGLKWVNYPTANTADNWTTSSGGNLLINNGEWDLRVRYLDRAGNEGAQSSQKIHVNKDFPRLVGLTAVQPNSTYRQGDKLEFRLEFADNVRINNAANVSITLTNRAASNTNNANGLNPSYEAVVPVTAQSGLSTTLRFELTLDRKEMLNGLYVRVVTLTGLQDRFGNNGASSTNSTFTASGGTVVFSGYTFNNNLSPGLIVDCIVPVISTYNPTNGQVLAASTNNRTVTLTFNEPVMIGTGRITVKPYGDYKIPAVLENNGSTVNGTYVAGFYDIYNNSALTAADKNTLTQSAGTPPSMGNLTLDDRTGQSVGPYIKLTQGLREGPGFTGNYSNTNPGADGPSPSGTYMVPDTSTKWVLDYRYSIDNASNTQFVDTSNNLQTPPQATVTNIRNVLTKAKWRWQEMELVSSVDFTNNDRTVTITLNEPLLAGLQWDFSFPAGAFTDKAGNAAAAVSGYWFWSSGVQAPVIRVNRKSFDARTANWRNTTGRTYSVPADRGGPGGWGIGDFNTVHYRIESETPGAEIISGTAPGGSITAAWTGTIANGRGWDNPNSANNSTTNTATNGDWVQGNLVRRSRSGSNSTGTYSVTENGFSTSRLITANHQGYRSYNSDVTKATLDVLGLNPFPGSGGNPTQGSFTYEPLQASKNYVVAQARITNGGTQYTSDRSYEGVFRSVVALKQDTFGGGIGGGNRNTNPLMVQGSNVKNGMPSISGFPVYDAGETGDNRFLKLFYYESFSGTADNMTNGRLYWVSTEIISQWYFLGVGRRASNNAADGGSHMSDGDVNNYLFSGYGDLTYSRNQR